MKKALKIISLIVLFLIVAFILFWSTCSIVFFPPLEAKNREVLALFLTPAIIIFIPTVAGIVFLIKNLGKTGK